MTKPIKILFDAGPLVNGPRSGVGKYTQGVIQALADDYPDQLELVGHYFDFLGRKHAANLPTAPNIRYRTTKLVPGKVFNMLRRLGAWVPFELLVKERGDFHFWPGFTGWPSLFKTPEAPMIHDLTYLDFPQYVNGPARYDLQKLMPVTIRRASFLLTNSHTCEQGLREAYATGDKPILVENIPPVDVVTVSQTEAKRALKDLGIDQDFILSFGTLEPRKNLVGLLNAYEKLPAKLRDKYALVLGGGKGWYDSEIMATLLEMQVKGRKIYQTGYVNDQVRAALYQEAAVYILPSFYEGFGMQLMEAMSYKVPMLISDIPILHEGAADTALYLDPYNVDDISHKLAKLLGDKKLQKTLVDRGTTRLKQYSWHKVTKDMFDQIYGQLK